MAPCYETARRKPRGAMTNRLEHETSPYLMQHTDNPADWLVGAIMGRQHILVRIRDIKLGQWLEGCKSIAILRSRQLPSFIELESWHAFTRLPAVKRVEVRPSGRCAVPFSAAGRVRHSLP